MADHDDDRDPLGDINGGGQHFVAPQVNLSADPNGQMQGDHHPQGEGQAPPPPGYVPPPQGHAPPPPDQPVHRTFISVHRFTLVDFQQNNPKEDEDDKSKHLSSKITHF